MNVYLISDDDRNKKVQTQTKHVCTCAWASYWGNARACVYANSIRCNRKISRRKRHTNTQTHSHTFIHIHGNLVVCSRLVSTLIYSTIKLTHKHTHTYTRIYIWKCNIVERDIYLIYSASYRLSRVEKLRAQRKESTKSYSAHKLSHSNVICVYNKPVYIDIRIYVGVPLNRCLSHLSRNNNKKPEQQQQQTATNSNNNIIALTIVIASHW